MKKIFTFLALTLFLNVYSQHMASQAAFHARIANQQITNMNRNFQNMSMMKKSSVTVQEVYEGKIKKLDKKIDDLYTKLHKEEINLVEIQNDTKPASDDSLQIEKKIMKSSKKINKIKADINSQDEKRTRYKDVITNVKVRKLKKAEKKKNKETKLFNFDASAKPVSPEGSSSSNPLLSENK